MADLHVVALIRAKPGSEGPLGDALQQLVAQTRQEEGCLSYDLAVSAADPTVYVTTERWTGQDALDAHMQSAHVQAAIAGGAELFAGAPEIHPLVPVQVD